MLKLVTIARGNIFFWVLCIFCKLRADSKWSLRFMTEYDTLDL